MLVFYLDDSDNANGPILAMAGYVASPEDWMAFETETEDFLSLHGVRVLRGKDFHNGHNDFKDWDGQRKSRFVTELYDIVKKHIKAGVLSVVEKKTTMEGLEKRTSLFQIFRHLA